jgi:hypothetical protein
LGTLAPITYLLFLFSRPQTFRLRWLSRVFCSEQQIATIKVARILVSLVLEFRAHSRLECDLLARDHRPEDNFWSSREQGLPPWWPRSGKNMTVGYSSTVCASQRYMRHQILQYSTLISTGTVPATAAFWEAVQGGFIVTGVYSVSHQCPSGIWVIKTSCGT